MKCLALLPALIAVAACTPPAPLPPDGSDIPWPQAVQLLQHCEVDSVFQLHDLTVSMTLKDGRTLHTVEPHIDAVISPDVMPPRCGNAAVIME